MLVCVQPLLFSGDLRFHLENHLRQQPLTVLSGLGVDVAGMLFAVRPDGGVAALPQVVIDLCDASGAWLATFTLVRLEGAGSGFLCGGFCLRFELSLANPLVNLACRRLPHLVRDMGVDVQRSAAGNVTNHRGESFDIHSMLQGHGGEQVAEIMEADMLAPGSLQTGGQVFADGGGV